MVASAILADVEPGLPARRNCVAPGKVMVKCERFDRWTVFPDGKMPPSMAGKDACRYIFRQALTAFCFLVSAFNLSRFLSRCAPRVETTRVRFSFSKRRNSIAEPIPNRFGILLENGRRRRPPVFGHCCRLMRRLCVECQPRPIVVETIAGAARMIP